MNRKVVRDLLVDTYNNSEDKLEFVLTVRTIDIRSVLTVLRHMQFINEVKDFELLNEENGTIKIIGFVP